MAMIITTAITIALSAGLIVGSYRFLNLRATASTGSKRQVLTEEIQTVTKELEDLLQYKDSFCSRGQLETVSKQLSSLQADLEKEKGALKELETRLDTAQTDVEGKEAQQQELKSSKEEDEEKLEELIGNYSEISSESIALEQRLAESMKNLDSIQGEITMTEEQKGVITGLSEALSAAGENLRDLITEYNTVNERLNMLTEQHEELEEEYTKLVEQQLGE